MLAKEDKDGKSSRRSKNITSKKNKQPSTFNNSALLSLVKTRKQDRKAKLVITPMNSIDTQNVKSLTTPKASSSFLQVSQPQIQFSSDSIIFSLVPNISDIAFSFQINKTAHQFLVLTSTFQMNPITFSLNQYLFKDITLPTNISTAVVNGMNYIVFHSVFNFPITIKMKDDLSIVIGSILNNIPEGSFPKSEGQVENICPISHEQIEIPGRGEKCTHTQCFDLKSFIQRGIEENNWNCPLCGQELEISSLRRDINFKARVHIKMLEMNCVSQFAENVTGLFDSYLGSMLEAEADPFME